MHENRNLFHFLIEINNMHRIRHILPIPITCIWRQCGVSWYRPWGSECMVIGSDRQTGSGRSCGD